MMQHAAFLCPCIQMDSPGSFALAVSGKIVLKTQDLHYFKLELILRHQLKLTETGAQQMH